MLKYLFRSVKIFLAFVLGYLLLSFLLVVYDEWGSEYYNHIQTTRSLDGKSNYCLYLQSGARWYSYLVVQFEADTMPPEKLAQNITHDEIKEPVLLHSDDESSEFSRAPSIEIIKGRFLVLKRGGRTFGMYDLKMGGAVSNIGDPFTEAITAKEKTATFDYGSWVKKNIEEKIEVYIAEHP